MLYSGLAAVCILEGPSNCPAWDSEELLGIVWLILENIDQYLWGFGMESIQEREGAQLFGEGWRWHRCLGGTCSSLRGFYRTL